MAPSHKHDLGPDQVGPWSKEAEMATLGCVLIDPDSFHAVVAAGLTPADFFMHHHRWIWEAYTDLVHAVPPVAIDIITVSEMLALHNQLAEAGGAAYLTELINVVPTSLHAVDYAQVVLRDSRRRQMLEIARQTATTAYTSADPVAAAEAAIQQLRRVAGAAAVRGGFMQDLVPKHIDHLVQLADDPEAAGVLATGLPQWDALTQGFFKGDFDLIAGKPGSGKTAMLLQIAAANAAPVNLFGAPKVARHVAHFSLEMPNDQVISRLMAQAGPLEVRKFRRASFTDAEWGTLYQLEGPLCSYALYLDDNAGLTLAQFVTTCHRLVLDWGLDLAIVDYVQLMGGSGENRTQELSAITRGLRNAALDLNICVIAGSQFSRKNEGRSDTRPVLSDLRDSGSLEQDATGVTFLHPDPQQLDAGDLIIAKQRNGALGQVRYVFDKPFSRFKAAEAYHIDLSAL